MKCVLGTFISFATVQKDRFPQDVNIFSYRQRQPSVIVHLSHAVYYWQSTGFNKLSCFKEVIKQYEKLAHSMVQTMPRSHVFRKQNYPKCTVDKCIIINEQDKKRFIYIYTLRWNEPCLLRKYFILIKMKYPAVLEQNAWALEASLGGLGIRLGASIASQGTTWLANAQTGLQDSCRLGLRPACEVPCMSDKLSYFCLLHE